MLSHFHFRLSRSSDTPRYQSPELAHADITVWSWDIGAGEIWGLSGARWVCTLQSKLQRFGV